eukprot:gene18503-25002_t
MHSSAAISVDELNTLRFLVHALCLRQCSSGDPGHVYSKIMELYGVPTEEDVEVAATRLLPALVQATGVDPSAAPGLTALEVAALVKKEVANAYGVLGPHNEDGERQIRGGALYSQSSLINHECIPNVARFDHFGGPSGSAGHSGNSASEVGVSFRALHVLPQGTEIVQSYFPLNWKFKERQQRCKQLYGFTCVCPRCQTEYKQTAEEEDNSDDWETDDGEEDMEDADAAKADETAKQDDPDDATAKQDDPDAANMAEDEDDESLPPGEEPALDPTYIQLFMLKYVCPQPDCFGTMAPRPPAEAAPDASPIFECSVCAHLRSEKEFLDDIEGGQ